MLCYYFKILPNVANYVRLYRSKKSKYSVLRLENYENLKNCLVGPDSTQVQYPIVRDYEEYVRRATSERTHYTHVCRLVRESIPPDFILGPHPACGYEENSHYSFDFAQQVHFPSDPLQTGPIYFKCTRKCGIFDVACEAFPKQVNFMLDESITTGKGANCVVSMLHYLFETYGVGECDVHRHADNCDGQNKNLRMMQYVMWRVLTGRHKTITMSSLLTGHTKFSCGLTIIQCECGPIVRH